MLQGEHSAIRLAFIKLPFVITIFVLPIFEWPFYTVLLYPSYKDLKDIYHVDNVYKNNWLSKTTTTATTTTTLMMLLNSVQAGFFFFFFACLSYVDFFNVFNKIFQQYHPKRVKQFVTRSGPTFCSG